MLNKSNHLEKSQQITFFKKKKKKKNKKKLPEKRQKKYPIFLVSPIEDISLRPELSSPARFRIQGGYPERDGGVVGVIVAGQHFRFLI